MTRTEFVSAFNLHDSLIENVKITGAGTTIEMEIDYAFWMQDNYREGDPETGLITVIFKNVSRYTMPSDIDWGETSILEMKEELLYLMYYKVSLF